MSRRVVWDTSSLVSAALRIGSTPHHALQKTFATCDLCASPETLAELERVMELRKFDRYLDRQLRREFVAFIKRNVNLYVVEKQDLAAVNPPCRDSQDNKFLALALVAEAEVLISCDEDLLALHPWHEIAILRPADFNSLSGI